MKAKLIAGGILLALLVLFTLQNAEVVQVRFLFWEASLSRVVLIFLVLGIGMLIGWGLKSLSRRA